MTWNYIDFNKKIITINANQIKNRKPHIIPISNQVCSLLNQTQPISAKVSQYVFCDRHDDGKPISENSIH